MEEKATAFEENEFSKSQQDPSNRQVSSSSGKVILPQVQCGTVLLASSSGRSKSCFGVNRPGGRAEAIEVHVHYVLGIPNGPRAELWAQDCLMCHTFPRTKQPQSVGSRAYGRQCAGSGWTVRDNCGTCLYSQHSRWLRQEDPEFTSSLGYIQNYVSKMGCGSVRLWSSLG